MATEYEPARRSVSVKAVHDDQLIGYLREPVIIVDYDPDWPIQFESIRAQVAIATAGMATSIEHVGSTSVPGLAAKPIVDVDVVVPSATEIPEVIGRLAVIGYQHRGDLGIAGREAFSAPAGTVPHHLYLCVQNSEPLREHLRFREILRSDPPVANRYGQLKRDLATRFSRDRIAYTNAKSQFIRGVLGQDATADPSEVPS